MKQLSEKQIDSMWIDADMDLSKFAKAIAKAHLELRQSDAALPVVAWMLEWTFDGEEKGQRLYDDERHCLLDAQSDGGICSPIVRLSDALAAIAAKDAKIAVLTAALQALLPFAQNTQDTGPSTDGWQSNELKKAIANAEDAIAQSAPSTFNEEPVAWRKANSEGFYRYYEADEEQPALCEPLYVKPIAQTEPPASSAKGPTDIWLQLHGDCSDDELSEPVDYTSGDITWCWHPINSSDVRYVRKDLSQPTELTTNKGKSK